MINNLYQFTNKGSFRALSLALALGLFAAVLLNASRFALAFGGAKLYLALLVFYAMAILWIHGVGFELKTRRWQALFLPLCAYAISALSLLRLFVFA